MSTNSTVVSTSSSSLGPSSSTTADTSSSTTPPSSTTTSTIRTTTPVPSSSSTTTTVSPTPIDTTSIVSASSAPPSATQTITSVITRTSADGTSVGPVTVVITTDTGATATGASSTGSASSSSSSSPASLQNQGSSNSSGSLSGAGKTAIAVVVPVVAVALLVLAALFFWRKRKQRKLAEEERRKEVEEYGYNPNGAPTLPALAADGQSEMAEDSAGGYRGWGAGRSARNPSTTLSAGNTQGQMSETGSNPGALSTSPTAFGGSDGQNSEMYKQRDTMNSDDLAALGTGPAANTNRNDMRRGPSNASSSYSAGHRSEHSDPSITHHPTNESSSPQGYGYGQAGPYGDGSYGGGDGMPVVRDVSARRHTRIEQGGAYQQGNSGIAQNF